MGRIPKKSQLTNQIVQPKENTAEKLSQESNRSIQETEDSRPAFVPREPVADRQSVTVPLKDGKLDFEALTDKRAEKLKAVFSTPEARRKLGLVQGGQSEAGGITTKIVAPLFGILGTAEGMAVSISAKIPRDVAISIMMLTDEEYREIAPLTASVLEKNAPMWLRNLLLSDKAEIGQLLMALFRIHQSKLEQIKAWKLVNQSGAPEPIPAAVN